MTSIAALKTQFLERIGNAIPIPSWCESGIYCIGLIQIYLYTWILDDACVYFRYIDNFLLGNGLVFNKGEYVEGFTSPAWCLLLLLTRGSGMGYGTIIPATGLVLFTVFWYFLVVINRRMSTPEAAAINMPLLLTATNFGVVTWFTSGMETPLQMVFAAIYAIFVLRPECKRWQAAIGFSFLVRPEYALLMASSFAWVWVKSRRFPWFIIPAWAVIIGPWMLFRVWYYADIFPNTYYVKDTTNFLAGIAYLIDALQPYHLVPFGLLFVLLVFFLLKTSSDSIVMAKERGVMLLMAGILTASTARFGGDTWHFRQMAFPVIMALCAASGIAEAVVAKINPQQRRIVSMLFCLVLGLVTLESYPRQLTTHPLLIKYEWRNVPDLGDLGKLSASMQYSKTNPFPHIFVDNIECPSIAFCRAFYDRVVKQAKAEFPAAAKPNVSYRKAMRSGLCLAAWENMDCYMVQSFGLTNPVLGRADLPSDIPGHKYGVDALAQDVCELTVRNNMTWRPGMYDHAGAEGNTPGWIRENIDSIRVLERKALNRHNLLENVRLAFSFPSPIHITPAGK